MKRRIFVISDLHLGGHPEKTIVRDGKESIVQGFQVCRDYQALTDFIDWVANQPLDNDEERELVINGDIVDYLAEDADGRGGAAMPWTADQQQALDKFHQAVARTRAGLRGDRGVFDALRDLAVRHRLTLLVGNHDVELSLPLVRKELLRILGGESPRLRFIYDGDAYTVGRALIEHGNRYDRWNMIDHSGLRQERSVRSRGLPINESLRSDYFFMPPAGTFLVICFMNPIKQRFSFVNFLQPEEDLVLPLLAVLAPEKELERKHLKSLLRIGLEFRRHGLAEATRPARAGDLGHAAPTPDGASNWALNLATLGIGATEPPTGEDLGAADDIMRRWRQIRDKVASVADSSAVQALGIHFELSEEKRLQKLHEALIKSSRRDIAFNIRSEKAAYFDAARATARYGGFDVIVYGHTHLPKEIHAPEEKDSPAFTYINTGTWAEVMTLPFQPTPSFEDDRPKLEAFIEVLRQNQYRQYLKTYQSYCEIEIDLKTQRAKANLHSYCGLGRERQPPLHSQG